MVFLKRRAAVHSNDYVVVFADASHRDALDIDPVLDQSRILNMHPVFYFNQLAWRASDHSSSHQGRHPFERKESELLGARNVATKKRWAMRRIKDLGVLCRDSGGCSAKYTCLRGVQVDNGRGAAPDVCCQF